MPRCAPLYTKATKERYPRSRVELAGDTIVLVSPDGRWRNLALHGCNFQILDSACSQRFVRHLILEWQPPNSARRVDLMTPPDRGAIAPRVARLPGVPKGTAVIEATAWEAIADWISRGGRVAGRTIAELAQLACIATPQFAVTLGKLAARAVGEMSWESCGPMRGSGGVSNPLRPLEEAAKHSRPAAAALEAAVANLSP